MKISSEVSIAYNEILGGFKESALTPQDMDEVLKSYCLNQFEQVELFIGEDEVEGENKGKSLWNILLYAIYYDQTEIVQHLLQSGVYDEFIDPMAIKKPPVNN